MQGGPMYDVLVYLWLLVCAYLLGIIAQHLGVFTAMYSKQVGIDAEWENSTISRPRKKLNRFLEWMRG